MNKEQAKALIQKIFDDLKLSKQERDVVNQALAVVSAEPTQPEIESVE